VRPQVLLLALLASALGAPAVQAQRAVGCVSASAGSPAATWAAPLNARVTLHAQDLSLRDAIDRVSAVAHMLIAYSSELLPLDRRS